MPSTQSDIRSDLAEEYRRVRSTTEWLAEPLGAEDQTVQSMPDVSPTKWHRAHTTWFFETFVLGHHQPGYRVYDSGFDYLFNSYYEAVGLHLQAQRGLISRPGVGEAPRPTARSSTTRGGAARRRCVRRGCRPGRAGPPPRAAAPGAAAHGHQARAVVQPDPRGLPTSGVATERRRSRDAPVRGSSSTAGWSRSDMTTRGSVRQRGPPASSVARAVPFGRPTRHVRRVARVHGRRRL